MMLDSFGVSEAGWRDALDPARAPVLRVAPAGFALSESPRYGGSQPDIWRALVERST